MSGISKPPAMLEHPRPIPIAEYSGIKDAYCYIIQHYGHTGIACLIARRSDSDTISLTVGDWDGNIIDLEDMKHTLTPIAKGFLARHAMDLSKLMHAIGLGQAIFYFALHVDNEFVLVDIRLGMDKFSGPGMVKDLCGKFVRVQETIKIDRLEEKLLESIMAGDGAYSGNIILKPSVFRSVAYQGKQIPLYVEIVR